MGVLGLLLNLEEGFHLLTIEYYVGGRLEVNDFDYVELCSLYTHFGEHFYEWILNCASAFSASIEMIM